MILIFEGESGTGKSTYAKALAEMLKIPIYKAFHGDDVELHWDSEEWQLPDTLKRLGVPVNSHVDDLYVCDLLSQLGTDVILDRSMPSAVAHGVVYKKWNGMYKNRTTIQWLYDFWVERLKVAGDPVLLLFTCEYEEAKRRRGKKHMPNKTNFRKLTTIMEKFFYNCDLIKLRIDTTNVAIEDGLDTVTRFLDSNSL